ncbi:MAG TPA: DUF1287 domain-containing protein [Caulobacter sp.]|nr:DUF1287 domain-containing protein [Caulobacter sp.]
MISRRALLAVPVALAAPALARAEETWATKLVAAAAAQIGETLTYDPAYATLAYPGGDVPRDRGVCTDVVIRAYRDGLGIDLQQRVHQDMAANFAAYPGTWGLRRPDRSIDHRRVPNLETFLRRAGAVLPAGTPWRAGDLATQRLPGNLPHILVVDSRMAAAGRPYAIHNVGAGARREDVLAAWPIVGHFRWRG